MSNEEVYKACADTGPNGYACERPRGHDGVHRALDGDEEWGDYGDDSIAPQDPVEQYQAFAWFVAGYVNALPDGIDAQTRAVTKGADAIERKREGRCLSCHRRGIVLLDGYFCENCAPDIEAAMEGMGP